jgi:hypothetical protein
MEKVGDEQYPAAPGPEEQEDIRKTVKVML